MKQPSLKNSWIWIIYFFLFTAFGAQRIMELLLKDAPFKLYYHILIGFNAIYIIPYLFDVLNNFFNIFSLIPLYLYICQKRFLKPSLWQIFFTLRITSEVFGHNFEFNAFYASFLQSPKETLMMLGHMALIVWPSYIICYRYAFEQKKLFNEGENINKN